MKEAENMNSIGEIREAIDRIDQEIIRLLGERYKCVKAIVPFKEPTKESIIAKDRFDTVISSRRVMAEKYGLNPDMVEKLYRDIMSYFIAEEMKMLNKKV